MRHFRRSGPFPWRRSRSPSGAACAIGVGLDPRKAPPMRGIVIHAPKDLRIEAVAAAAPGPRQVRVRIESGGICGSDLHYYHHGGFGAVRIREPMVLGHEIAGTLEEVGAELS